MTDKIIELLNGFDQNELKLTYKLLNSMSETKKTNSLYKNILKEIFADEEFKKCLSYKTLYSKYYPNDNKAPYILNIPDHTKPEFLSLNKKNKKKQMKKIDYPLKISINNVIYIIVNSKIYNSEGKYVGIINNSLIINNTKIICNKIDKSILSSYKNYEKDSLIIDNDSNLFKKIGGFVFLVGIVKDNKAQFYED
jgi:hypothetical protein